MHWWIDVQTYCILYKRMDWWINGWIVGWIYRSIDRWIDWINWWMEWQIDDMNKRLNSNCPHFHSFKCGFQDDTYGQYKSIEDYVDLKTISFETLSLRSLSTFMNAFTDKWVCSICTHACILLCTCIYMYMYNCGQCGVYQQIVSNSIIHVLITSCCYGSINMMH